VLDSSGNHNDGTVSGARRRAGKYGGALQFDGVNDMVTVADSDSLDLTEAMTLEAWVKPSALGSMWRTVVIKEQRNQLAYALYAGNGNAKPSGHVYTTGDRAVAGGSAVPTGSWTHVASTWDGQLLRLYINGVQVAKAALKPSAMSSSRALRFGGNTVWPEWFKGAIDEIRIYSRALTPEEIDADRMTAVGLTRDLTTKIRRHAAGKKQQVGKRRGSRRQQRRHRARWLR
jgi:predicted GIY-YIG superfamily endonuclease